MRAHEYVDVPSEYLPDGVSGAGYDERVLRSAAEAHCRHAFDHDMNVKAWVVLHLLDRAQARPRDEPGTA